MSQPPSSPVTPSPRHPLTPSSAPWYHELTRYHWFVLIVCMLGWLFDCLDQQLFALERTPAVAELLSVKENDPRVAECTGYATSILLIGWATGGIFFGILGDRLGRARTMVFTILSYSVFTGLSGVSQTVWDFIFYRFMTGLGVGGQFAVGVALVADVMPDRARPRALGMLQAFSAFGNVSAALIAMGFGQLEEAGVLPTSAWRWIFGIGILPGLLAVLVIRHLKEPERWKHAVAEQAPGRHKAGSLAELFGDPVWRKRTIVGMLLALSGVIGLWGIGFFSIDLNRSIFRRASEQRARDEGQAAQDRQFVEMVLADPKLLDQASEAGEPIEPRDLVSLDASNQDPRRIYQAALALRKEGRTVSPAAVLDRLDQPLDGRPGQSAAERERREKYLEASRKTSPLPLGEGQGEGDVANPRKGPHRNPLPKGEGTSRLRLSAPSAGAASGGPSKETFAEHLERITARRKAINGVVSRWGSITSMLFNIGAFFGIYAFAIVTQRIGRRPTFALALLAAFFSTAVAFVFMNGMWDVLWMVPLMGFCQLSLFGGYAIYFPELFPTRLRSTGTSFCYNIGRFAAAAGPAALGLLTSEVFTEARGFHEPMRYAGLTMCSVFLLGLLVLLFAPETKDEPLPE